jgi:hypothetical protein
MNQQYETDFYAWTNDQADLLEKRSFDQLDIENLVEEIKCLGSERERALESFLRNLFTHLLKDQYQPSMKTSSWEITIKRSVNDAKKTIRKNPGLKSKLKEIAKDAYEDATYEAALQTGMQQSIFPEDCPWDIEEILNNEE